MQIALADYVFEQVLHNSNRTIVYRDRTTDRQTVVVKILKAELQRTEQIARFKQEYQILTQLDSTAIIKAYGLEKFQNKLALILEDFAGESLENFTQKKSW